MKKSEFLKKLSCGRPDRVVVAIAEEAGVKWDPEEPNLPERVNASMFTLQPDLQRVDIDARLHLYKEAAARYNAYGRLLGRDPASWTLLETQRILESERQRQEPPF